MSEIGTLYAVGVTYLAALFFVAYATDNRWLPDSLVRHPLVYALALGVYATSWTYYGSVGFAQIQGYNFLTIYIGVTLAFVLAPVMLAPLLRLVREHQLTSIADLFAFRYPSPWTGTVVTLFMLVGVLPYIALQIKAVSESVAVITQEAPPHLLALGFCATLTLFAILFGARHITPREKHEGLVVAIAFESAVKLLALLGVGALALFGVFGGPDGLGHWLSEHPSAIHALYAPVREGPWFTCILLAFAAGFLLPRQFHMLFVENMDPRALKTAAWAFPAFLLLLNLPIPLVLWAGHAADLDMSADYYVLGLVAEHGSRWLMLATFVGGVSAASAMMIVTTLALAGMCLNHLILPAHFQQQTLPRENLYGWLLWGRRTLIVVIIAMGYGFYRLLEVHHGLVQIGLISFVAVTQFLPGLAGLLLWPRATRTGFLAGLIGGIGVWATSLILPLLFQSGLPVSDFNLQHWLGASSQDRWTFATFWSLSINGALFVAGSLLTRPTEREQAAAAAMRPRDAAETPPTVPEARSVGEFEERLAQALGPQTANMELARALSDLGLAHNASRPAELGRLRERLERNLSGLIGPALSRMIVDNRLQVAPPARRALADSLRFVEARLAHSNVRLQGLAAELDTLRRYHREVLEELPLGVCSLTPEGEILIWNSAMARISGIAGNRAIGRTLADLDPPWQGVLSAFTEGDENHLYKLQFGVRGHDRWINLHKAAIESLGGEGTGPAGIEGTVVLVEDLTELHVLESEVTHNDRLASIGRLAAGVAHEIGNPLTGIASLAQNLRFETDAAEQDACVRQILVQTRRISDIVQSLITFAHAGNDPSATREAVRLRECVDEAIHLVQLGREGRGIVCENHVPPDIEVHANAQRMLQVFVNLLSNAIHASGEGDRIRVEARRDGDTVEISVDDEGRGIPSELIERIFEPFFTTKPAGQGTGLGLSVVYSIVDEHGGTVSAANRPERGTRFTLRLPAEATPA
ncbi:sensor histidine kinase [Pseudazoarcus pumilus]|uniref:histidine kinase n=1 Tax=Pseudazoarcus pumilus TaxID=2067960 RepID=A0A2I6S973_9RHOO|nr:sensor histidine kinase [Pseudazoarcus pumilus]AUN95781.1 histidine kinase [Pseudazoarcus pumilus]